MGNILTNRSSWPHLNPFINLNIIKIKKIRYGWTSFQKEKRKKEKKITEAESDQVSAPTNNL